MAKISKSTQEFVPIKEIRDGVIILKDKSLRAVLMASTLNFALKSEDEQNAIIMQYQNFLNSLDFSIQFFIESRKLDIGNYVSLLEDAGKKQTNDLLKIQIREYVEFIKNFVSSTNIVEKIFYVVVPYSSSAVSSSGGSPLGGVLKFFGGGKKDGANKDIRFEEAKLQIQQRAGVVQQGLMRAGIRSAPLNTEELIELYYKLFNPGEMDPIIAKQNAAEER